MVYCSYSPEGIIALAAPKRGPVLGGINMVKILSDSTCDLSEELIERYAIGILRLSVVFGEETGRDGIEATRHRIYDYVESTGDLPTTSACNIGEYEKKFRHWRGQGYEIVHFSLGSKFSSSYQNACIAARELDGVYVVDSENLSVGQGLLVLRAAELAQAGLSGAEIRDACQQMVPKLETSFLISHLDYLYKGGRCSGLSLLGANLLKLNPCIELRDGEMLPGKKYRGALMRAAADYADDRLGQRKDIDLHRIALACTDCPEEVFSMLREKIHQLCPTVEEIVELHAGATITTHCGSDCLGIVFMRK